MMYFKIVDDEPTPKLVYDDLEKEIFERKKIPIIKRPNTTCNNQSHIKFLIILKIYNFGKIITYLNI